VIVVSDTSPLNYLVLIGAVEVLPAMFGDVYVPEQVMEELRRAKTPPLVRAWALNSPSWLKIVATTGGISFTERIDPGEASAIVLAEELGATLLLIDDRRGKRVAVQRGLNAIGTIAVLELAARKNLIDLQSTFEALQKTTFRISQDHLKDALNR
jgi:predicted nucleic acid-binding protein